MLKKTSVRIVLVLLAAALLGGGAWLYSQRAKRIEIAAYVPESALGFLEINSLPQLLDHFTSTKAWQQVAPAYGISDKLNYIAKLGQVGWLTRLVGNGETTMLAQSQIALVVTSLEVRGEAVKPRLALVAETHSRAKTLEGVVEKRLPELAQSLFGQAEKEMTEYAGVRVTNYGVARTERRLLAAQIEGELILANHEEALRACIDVRLGRMPSMAGDFYLPRARPAVRAVGSGEVDVFGFVTAEGVKRLLRFGAHVAAGGLVGKAALAGAVGEVFTNFASKACDGIAYGASFENGSNGLQAVDRYALLFKPEMAETLKTAIKTSSAGPQALNLVPPSAHEATVIRVANPSQTLDSIEKAVSARVDVAQSFILHQFVIGMREAAFGAKSAELTAAAVGDEIINFNSTEEPADRVWLVAARDRAMTARLAESLLTQFQRNRGATIRREEISGVEVMNSTEPSRGSAAFIGNALALGRREQLIQLIEAHRRGQSLQVAPQFKAASNALPAAPYLTFSSVKEESNEMMIALARAFGITPIPEQVAALEQLPMAASVTLFNEQGALVESRSPFGNIPFVVSLIAGSGKDSTSR